VTGGYLPAVWDWSCEPSSTCGPSIRFEKCVPLQSEESWHSFWFVCNTTTTKSKKFQSQKVEFVGYKNNEWIWLLLTWWLRQHSLSSTTDAVFRLVSIFCYISVVLLLWQQSSLNLSLDARCRWTQPAAAQQKKTNLEITSQILL
jgi:hypothetical protein